MLKAGTGGWNRRPGQKKRKIYVLFKQRAEEKSPIRLGSPTVKETAVHTEKEWSGKMGWKE